MCIPLVMAMIFFCMDTAQPISSSRSENTIRGTLTPSHPVLKEGDTLELTCTITTPKTDSACLTFMIENEVIEETFVKRGPQWAALRWPNVHANHSQSQVLCLCLDSNEEAGASVSLASVILEVYKRPLPANVTQCIVYHWKRMECQWAPSDEQQSVHTGLRTSQTLYWSVINPLYWSVNNPNKSFNHWQRCAFPGDSECRWEKGHDIGAVFYDDTIYYLKVVAVNDMDSVESPVQSIDTKVLVKLDQVHSVQNVSYNQTEISLSWKRPNDIYYRAVYYRVRYYSEWQPTLVTNITLRNVTAVVLRNLNPGTTYTMHIDCLPIVIVNYSTETRAPRGFWTNVTRFIVKTAPGVPSSAPGLTDGGFYVDDVSRTARTVYVYTKAIPPIERRGEIKEVRVRYSQIDDTSCAGSKKIHHSKNSSVVCVVSKNTTCLVNTLTLTKNAAYVLTVDAATSEGYNNQLVFDHIVILEEEQLSRMRSPLKSMVIIKDTHSSSVSVTWNPVPNAIRYTLYRCRGRSQCRESAETDNGMVWHHVHGNETSAVLKLGDIHQEYVYAISAEFAHTCGRVVSSGMVFYNRCVYDIHKNLSVPKNFTVDKNQKPGCLSLEWTNPKCTGTGFISKYLITYCEKKDNCAEGIYTFINVSATKQNVDISNLVPGTEYKVCLQSWSPYDQSVLTCNDFLVATDAALPTKYVIVLCISSILVFILVTLGTTTIVRSCQRKLWEKVKVLDIILPDFEDDDVKTWERSSICVRQEDVSKSKSSSSESGFRSCENYSLEGIKASLSNGDIHGTGGLCSKTTLHSSMPLLTEIDTTGGIRKTRIISSDV